MSNFTDVHSYVTFSSNQIILSIIGVKQTVTKSSGPPFEQKIQNTSSGNKK